MSNFSYAHLAVLNGIKSLSDETAMRSITPADLAARYAEKAQALGNERAAAYWQVVAATCRRIGL